MGPEIQAKLGVDTSSVATDLAGAKNIFNKWGNEVAASGESHGASFGGKLVGSIEHKIGAAHLGNALAAALGFNIEKIADKIAEVIAFGSKEGWAEAERLADENTKLIKEKFTDSLTPKRLAEELDKELRKTIAKLEAIKPTKDFQYYDEDAGKAVFSNGSLSDEQAKEQEKTKKEILEIEKKIRDLKKDEGKDVKEYEEARKKIGLEELSDGNKIDELNKQILATTDEMLKGDLTAGELAKKKISILEMEHQIKEAMLRITKEDGELLKKTAEAEEKAGKEKIAREEKLFSLQRARFNEEKKLRDDQNKVTDRSKLTVGELANLNGKSKQFSLGNQGFRNDFGENAGLTFDQEAAKEKAKKIQDLEAEAEAKRLSGDVAGSEESFGKVGQLRDELVKSGATKSSEGDKFADLQKQIAQDSIELQKTLKDLIAVEKGKFVSQ
jgi:hypothetical protein